MNGAPTAALLPDGVQVIERGWLSANTTVLRGDPRGAVLIDTGYCTHKAQTLSLVQECLSNEAQQPRLIVNTHLHSDHCGGNAHLAAAFGCPIWIPPGQYQAALDWDQQSLSYQATGQQCERFMPAAALRPGDVIEQADLQWQVLAAPGHDPHSLILFEPSTGTLISADALWEHGFGIVFPELDGEAGFDEVEHSLDLIAALPVRQVIPGHGPVFSDAGTALSEARSRLAFFRQYPERHTRHAAKALLMFHMLELGATNKAELFAWLDAAPIHHLMWQRHFSQTSLRVWNEELVQELSKTGALKATGDTVECS